jgi:hypothetical protein
MMAWASSSIITRVSNAGGWCDYFWLHYLVADGRFGLI